MDEQQIKKLRRDLTFTRIMCLITSVLTILLLVGGGYLLNQVRGIMGQVQPVLDQAAAVDIENVNATLRQVKVSLENVDLEQVAEMMEQAVETLNEVRSQRPPSYLDTGVCQQIASSSHPPCSLFCIVLDA